MAGRPGKIYLPKPFCSAGHRRTEKSTDWNYHKINGRVYLMARCKFCVSVQRKLYYQHRRKREARMMEAAE